MLRDVRSGSRGAVVGPFAPEILHVLSILRNPRQNVEKGILVKVSFNSIDIERETRVRASRHHQAGYKKILSREEKKLTSSSSDSIISSFSITDSALATEC